MHKCNYKPACLYEFKSTMVSLLVFLGVLLLIVVVLAIFGDSAFFNGMEFTSAITAFVIGVVALRENLRLFIQNGIGRRTSFLMQLFLALLVGSVLSIGSELLLALGQVLSQNNPGVEIVSLYQMIFYRYIADLTPLTVHLTIMTGTFLMCIAALSCGTFISLLFYKLNKVWTLVVSIGVPVFFLMILPMLCSYFSFMYIIAEKISNFILYAVHSPLSLSLSLLLVFFLFSSINWLMIRRVAIK